MKMSTERAQISSLCLLLPLELVSLLAKCLLKKIVSSSSDLSNLRMFLQLKEALLYLKSEYCSIGKNFLRSFPRQKFGNKYT